MSLISTIQGKCKRCYTCVRNCPVKAIKVEQGTAKVIQDLCVSCGTCVRVCNQKAKKIQSDIDLIKQELFNNTPLAALLAPSFPASFYNYRPKQVISALRKLGFRYVYEIAFGAELVASEHRKLILQPSVIKPLIASPCPVVIFLIEKHFPHLIPHLAPIVSPLIASAKYIKSVLHPNKTIKTVFIGPCIAKKQEILEPQYFDLVDYALTFKEIKHLFDENKILIDTLEDSNSDPPHPGKARMFPLVGGILKTAGFGTDILDESIAIIEGSSETLEFLRSTLHSMPTQDFIDILFCKGCIDGVEIDSDLPYLQKHRKVLDFANENLHFKLFYSDKINLNRSFSNKKIDLQEPTDEQIKFILASFGKFKPEDQLNCGTCGYPTCVEKAKAVFYGFAEPEMCLPYIIQQLEESYHELQKSHEELKKTQDELLHSVKLASLGQLSAGVAHELNNPLGGILLYANILLDRFKKDPSLSSNSIPEEIEIIVKEATRCRNIVRGLLDFARQSKLQKAYLNITALIQEIVNLELKQASTFIQTHLNFPQDLPMCYLDPVQIRQALTNVIHNAIEAMPNGGTLTIDVCYDKLTKIIKIAISDTGIGIAEENLPKLFTPFYTTKAVGKGTGLGLAITYGIIKMHRGSISVKSKLNQGTTFTISLPIDNYENNNSMEVKNGKNFHN